MTRKILLSTVLFGAFLFSSNICTMNIFDAIKKDDIARVQKLIESGADVNQINENGQTPLHAACFFDSLKIVRLLLKKGAKKTINVQNKNGLTPLHWACEKNNLKTTELLLKNGATKSVDTPENNYGMTPLFLACNKNNLKMATLLLQYGANVNHVNVNGETLLFLACYHSNLEVVKLLLKNGAKETINKANLSKKTTPLHLACSRSWRIAELLLNNGANVNKDNSTGEKPIHDSCRCNNLAMAQLLLENCLKITNKEIIATDNQQLKNYFQVMINFDESKNKLEVLEKQKNKKTKMFNLLVRTIFCRLIQEMLGGSNRCFFQLYHQAKTDNKIKKVLDGMLKEKTANPYIKLLQKMVAANDRFFGKLYLQKKPKGKFCDCKIVCE